MNLNDFSIRRAGDLYHATINDPTNATEIARVGNAAYKPLHSISGPFPIGAGGAYRISATSGTMAVSLGANAEIYQFRYVTAAARRCLVFGVSISAAWNVAATTAVLSAFRMTIARAWTVAGSGGTRLSLAGNNNKARTSFATSEVSDIGISTTGGLTAGTKTLDGNDCGGVSWAQGTGAITTGGSLTLVPKTNLWGEFTASLAWPLELATQEGFVIRIGPNSLAAGQTWNFTVDLIWSEVDAF